MKRWKRGRVFLSGLMITMMIVSLLQGIRFSESNAKDNNWENGAEVTSDGIKVSKKVVSYDAETKDFAIELTVEGDEDLERNKGLLDVVLLMDTSSNMSVDSKLNTSKETANNFVKALTSKINEGKVRIGIAKFADDGKVIENITNDISKLSSAINGLSANGGAYIQAGLETAAGMLKNSNAATKAILVVSDGNANYGYGTYPILDINKAKKIISPESDEDYPEYWYLENKDGKIRWLGKGYEPEYENYEVKREVGKFGSGAFYLPDDEGYESHYTDNLLKEYGYFEDAASAAAHKIQKNGVEVFSIGIGVGEDSSADRLLRAISSDVNYYAETSFEYLLDRMKDIVRVNYTTKIEDGVISDSMGEYVEFQEGSVEISGVKEGSEEEQLELKARISNIDRYVTDNDTHIFSNIKLGKGEILKIKYKVKLKDEWRDGIPHPANGETTLLPTPKGTKIRFNVPKIWEDLSTRRLTVKKKWINGKSYNKNVKISITSSTENTKTLELTENNNFKDSIDLPVYDKDNKLIKYVVKEEPLNDPAEEHNTSAKLSPDNKTYQADSISFTFDKIGEIIPSREIVFTNTLVDTKAIKVRKIWKDEAAKEAKFVLVVNGEESGALSGEGETFEILTLNEKNAVSGKTNVWEGEFKLKRPLYREVADSRFPQRLYYGVEELDENGKKITYGLDRDPNTAVNRNVGVVKLGNNAYKVSKSFDSETNTYEFINEKSEKRNIQINKNWVGKPGKAKFALFKKGETKQLDYSEKQIELADEVIVRFENVDILDENGNIIQYEVKELGPDNTVLNDGDSVIIDDIRYKVVYDEYGNITNAEPLDLTVKKEWAENVPSSERKSVEISVVDGNN